MYVNGKDAVVIPSEARPILFRAGSCQRDIAVTILYPEKRNRSPQECLIR